MARVPRCLLDELNPGVHSLAADAAHHLGRVLRLADGAPLELVDGRGGLARGRWLRDGRVQLDELLRPACPPTRRVVLAVAPPRPSRLDWLVEKAAELGVHELALLGSAHAVRDVGPARLRRLSRKAEEAMLQSRRLHRMEIEAPRPLAARLSAPRSGALWLASPPHDGPTAGHAPPARPPGDVTLLVGPEGGFDDAERAEALAAGACEVSLGTGVLRVETAALAMVVLAGAS